MSRFRAFVTLALVLGAASPLACGGSGDDSSTSGIGNVKNGKTGSKTGTKTGTDSGTDTGTDSGTDTGNDSGNDSGAGANDSGSDSGAGANGQGANGQGANGQGANGQGANGSGASGGAPGSGGDGNGGSFNGKSCAAQTDCDDGNPCSTDACSNGICVVVAKPNPSGSSKTDCGGGKLCINGHCTTNKCGDGVKLGGEECDDGTKNGSDGICSADCKVASCGNGMVDGGNGELCDDGNQNNFDGCLNNCLTPGNSDGTPFGLDVDGQGLSLTDPDGNLEIDPKNQLTSQMSHRYLWVANSGEGTESKIDTAEPNPHEVGRYCTAPGCGADPSRSTVGLSGDVVVANRHGGSSIRIVADENTCVDKNGNGTVDTSHGSSPMPWDASQAVSPDECVQWFHDFNSEFGQGTLPRAAGFDALVGDQGQQSTYVYMGLFSAGLILRMNATNGDIVKKIPIPGNPYGLVLDTNGSVWVQAISALVRIDVKNNDQVTAFPPSPCMYGIAADSKNRIYTAGSTCLARFDPVSESWSVGQGHAGTFYGGVALDDDFNAWVADYSQLVRFDASQDSGAPSYLGAGPPGNGGHGCAVDFDHHIWAIDIFNSKAWKYNSPVGKNAGDFGFDGVVPTGSGPYTYSDMTGYQLVNAASRAGAYKHTFVGCGDDTNWTEIEVVADVPANTSINVGARVGPDELSIKDLDFIPVATMPPDTSPFKVHLPHGNVIQVSVGFSSKDNMATPIVAFVGATNNNCGKL